jgi:hypothetical protein
MATPTFILPSAPTYTEGFVNGLNVYPNPTNFVANQVPFTRATTATRTNAAGLIELVPYNLVQYSEQFDNAYWLKQQGGVAIAPVVTANVELAPNGTLTADRIVFNLNSGTTFGDFSQLSSDSFTYNSDTRTQSFYLRTTDNTTKVFTYVSPANSQTLITVTQNWERFTFTSIGAGTNTIRLRLRGTEGTATSASVAVWGAQFVEGTVAKDYQLTETRLNIPRVDFSLGGCPNLLLEPQRTNVLQRSEEFNDAYWGKQSGATVVANTAVSPSGIQNADTVNLVSGSTISRIERVAISILANTYYTVSIYLKNISLTSGQTFQIRLETSGFDLRGTIDLFNKTNTVSITGTTVTGYVSGTQSASITELSNGWVRCNITVQSGTIAVGTGTFYIITNVDANRSFYAWGAQFELGAYPTTYIPTSSASVTRNADSFALSNVFTNDLISSAGGTWFMNLRMPTRLRDNGNAIMSITDTTLNDISLSGGTSGATYIISKNVNGIFSNIYISTVNQNNPIKLAIKWNGTTADVFQNGVKVVSATAFTATALQSFRTAPSGVGAPAFINSMALYNTPISDAECIAITTL